MNEKLKSTRSYFLDGYNTHSLDVGRWIAFWRICGMESINYKRIIKEIDENENSETGYFQEEIQDQERKKGFSVAGSGNVGKSITRRR